MLPSYSAPYQPYYFMTTIPSQFTPMVYQNNGPFYVQSYLPQMGFPAPFSTQNCSFLLPNVPTLQKQNNYIGLSPNEPREGEMSKISKNIYKEKFIKKPANRPATYLTERKFYLAQQLLQEENSQRKLRPRKLKKRSHRTIPSTPQLQQNKEQPSLDELQPVQTIMLPKEPVIIQQKQKASNCESSKGEEKETHLSGGARQSREGAQAISAISHQAQR